jgi:GT2 family glycosyltransferase
MTDAPGVVVPGSPVSGARRPTVSVVIACYTEDRWDGLNGTVRSALRQTVPPLEVIVAVDHNSALAMRVTRELPAVRVVENTASTGASGTRNAGAFVAEGDVLAFLDDDTVASPTWVADLLDGLTADEQVVGVGGRVVASWEEGCPRWFPPEFLWVVGASYEGMAGASVEVRNVWSENMAVWRSAFERVGGFRAGFGKVGSVPQPEDTEFCIRLSAATGRPWLNLPGADVAHVVPRERATWRFFIARCRHEGRGKAEMSALGGADSLGPERLHIQRAISRGLLRDLRAGFGGDVDGWRRAATACIGLLAAVYGFGQGWLSRRVRPAS